MPKYKENTIEFAIAEHSTNEEEDADETFNARLQEFSRDDLIGFIEEAQSKGAFSYITL